MSSSFSAGRLIGGKYRLVSHLGDGGFGTVWRAHDEQRNRDVAVKFLTAVDEDAARRFDIEIDVLMRLRDPGILRPIDHGRTEDGVPFLVTEFVDGVTLDAWIRSSPGVDDVRATVLRLAEILRCAHMNGVVHRDLKPANIIMRAVDGRPSVLDFGIAKLIGRHGPDVTKTGVVLGTPGYMSPEQLRGERDVGASTDMYALGVLLFEMLERRPLHRADSPLAVAMKHLNEPAPPLQKAPPDLAELTHRLLKKTPAHRPTATAVVHQLGGGSTVAVVTEAPRWPLAAVGLACVVGAVIGLTYIASAPSPNPPPRASERHVGTALLRTPDAEISLPDAQTDGGEDEGSGACPGFEVLRPGSQAAPDVDYGAQIHIPNGYTPKKRYPVVVFLHDAYQEPAEAIGNLDFGVPLADEFVFFAPRGEVENLGRGQWDDVGLVGDGLSRLEKTVCIDREQLFLIGHGHGGRGVGRLRCLESPVAVATFGYRKGKSRAFCSRNPSPALMIFAMEDQTAPAEGGRGCNSELNLSVERHVSVARGLNGCTGEPRPRGDGCYESDCEIPFVHCKVPGSRRWRAPYNAVVQTAIWTGRCEAFPETTFPATRTILEFFDSVRNDTQGTTVGEPDFAQETQ